MVKGVEQEAAMVGMSETGGHIGRNMRTDIGAQSVSS